MCFYVTGGEFNRDQSAEYKADMAKFANVGPTHVLDVKTIGDRVVPTVRLVLNELILKYDAMTQHQTRLERALGAYLRSVEFVDTWRLRIGRQTGDNSLSAQWRRASNAATAATVTSDLSTCLEQLSQLHEEQKSAERKESWYMDRWSQLVSDRMGWPSNWMANEKYEHFLDMLGADTAQTEEIMGDQKLFLLYKKSIKAFFPLRPPFPATDIVNTAAFVHGMHGDFDVESVWHTIRYGHHDRRRVPSCTYWFVDSETDDLVATEYARMRVPHSSFMHVTYYLPEGTTPENKHVLDEFASMLQEHANARLAPDSCVIRTPHARNEQAVISIARKLLSQ